MKEKNKESKYKGNSVLGTTNYVIREKCEI